MKNLVQVSLRQNAIFIATSDMIAPAKMLSSTTSTLVANLGKLGYDVSEPLLRALNQTSPRFQADLLENFRTVMGVNKNWTPLVKGWDVPTQETFEDHLRTLFFNAFKIAGTQLTCGHVIPSNTFALERYNGCPFCGTPFEFGKIENYSQGSKRKMLDLWTNANIEQFLKDLLESKTALDATQIDSLKILLGALPFPKVEIGMKETLMVIVDAFISQNDVEKAGSFFSNPNEILRYLWYKQTGFLQIVEPKTIVKRHALNNAHLAAWLSTSGRERVQKIADLKLKYSRKDCLMVAQWLNNLDLSAQKACEIMHPKRSMWVRFIRALRLAEYAKKEGFGNLAVLLDTFYNQTYEVWQGRVNHFKLKLNNVETFKLLKQRPGLFARSLFANMLWFGPSETLEAFAEVADQVPARLLFTLNMYAKNYFDPSQERLVKPLGGVSKRIPANVLLTIYSEEQLSAMQAQIEDLCLDTMKKRFARIENTNKTMFIAPQLFNMPLAIGDRSESIQDMPVALMGTRYKVEGNAVRLFMQWGEGMPAQHLDMDLSAYVAYPNKIEHCSYSNLSPAGCKHSGDIRSIPEKVGTAEYIELNINELDALSAQYVTFVCNAFSNGGMTPNMIVGWMNSKNTMKISGTTGVAYDPSCVQHQVRVTQVLSKGLVFGVLDVKSREIVWLEMPFQGQVVQQLDIKGVDALLAKLNAKMTIGTLLNIKAEAQGLMLVDTTDADETYTMEWAINAANVTRLLID